MAKIYAALILNPNVDKYKTLDDVPEKLRAEVEALLNAN